MLPDKTEGNLITTVMDILKSLMRSYGDIFHLAYLETCLASKSILLILFFIILGSIFALTAWAFFMLFGFLWLQPLMGGIKGMSGCACMTCMSGSPTGTKKLTTQPQVLTESPRLCLDVRWLVKARTGRRTPLRK